MLSALSARQGIQVACLGLSMDTTVKNEECDGVFSHDDVVFMGYDDTRGVGYLDTLTEKYPIGVKENQAEDQGSTAQTGNVSAWVRMLTEEAASLSDGGGRASTAPTGTSRPAASQTECTAQSPWDP